MTNALNPPPTSQMFVSIPSSTGTVQQGTGGYTTPQQLTALLPQVFDAGHLLPSKALEDHPLQTPATRANIWQFFMTNLGNLFFSPMQYETNTTQGRAERTAGGPDTTGVSFTRTTGGKEPVPSRLRYD
jgi:hypothetical protein